jgi:hypothetical protein
MDSGSPFGQDTKARNDGPRHVSIGDDGPTGEVVGVSRRRAGRRLRDLLDFGPGWWRGPAERASFLGITTAVLVLGYLQGVTPITLPVAALSVPVGVPLPLSGAVMACATFTGFVGLSGLLLVDTLRGRDREGPLPRSGPSVTAVVPVHRDAAALHRSVESLLESRYEDLQVVVVPEAGDIPSVERARELAAHPDVTCSVNTHNPGSKAGAIEHAAETTESDLLAVFDADERVNPEFVPAAVAELRDCDAVQGRTVPEPDGAVETMAYYESVLLGYLGHRLLGRLADFRMATSRAVVVDRDAFAAVGGYDDRMLTEDFDFAFRCHEAGLDVREVFDHPSRIEAAHGVTDWWGQRKRWATGYAQVLASRLHRADPTDTRGLFSLAVCAGSVLGNLLLLSLVTKLAALLVVGPAWLLGVPLGTAVGLALAVRLLDYRAGHVDSVGLGWLLAPLVFPLYSLVGIKGTTEYLFTWDGEWFHAAKGA